MIQDNMKFKFKEKTIIDKSFEKFILSLDNIYEVVGIHETIRDMLFKIETTDKIKKLARTSLNLSHTYSQKLRTVEKNFYIELSENIIDGKISRVIFNSLYKKHFSNINEFYDSNNQLNIFDSFDISILDNYNLTRVMNDIIICCNYHHDYSLSAGLGKLKFLKFFIQNVSNTNCLPTYDENIDILKLYIKNIDRNILFLQEQSNQFNDNIFKGFNSSKDLKKHLSFFY